MLVLLAIVLAEDLVIDLVGALVLNYIHQFHEICSYSIFKLTSLTCFTEHWNCLVARHAPIHGSIVAEHLIYHSTRTLFEELIRRGWAHSVITTSKALVCHLRLTAVGLGCAIVLGLKLFALPECQWEELFDGFLLEAGRTANAGVASMVYHGFRRLG